VTQSTANLGISRRLKKPGVRLRVVPVRRVVHRHGMNRRQFLQSTASLMTLAAWRALAAESGIDLGFSLYGMKSLALDEALRVCSEIGYRNVELALNAGFPTEPKSLDQAARRHLREQLDLRRLSVSALMVNMSLTVDDAAHARNLDAIKDAGKLGRDLYPDRAPLIETVLGGKPAEWDASKEKMAGRLRDWADTASAAGVVIALKAHVGSAVNSPERLLWLLGQTHSSSLCVAYDFSHYELAGMTLEESLRPLIGQTRFIHVKDAAGDSKKFQFLLPGQGRTDYSAYFKLLKSLNYRGPVVVEVSAQVFNKAGYDPIAAAKESYAALAKAV
jgi:inosose dehydratase